MDKERLKQLKAVNSELELLSLVKGLGWEALNSREIDVLAKALGRCLDKPDMRIAYLGSHTIDPLPSYIAAGALLEGIKLSSYIAPFNQYVQEVLDHSSDFHVFDPDLVLLSTQMVDLCPRVHYDFASLSEKDADAERNWIITHLRDWASAALKSTKATVLVPNFPRPGYPSLGIADAKQELGESEFYLSLNLELLRMFKHQQRVHVFDLDRMVSRFGSERARSFKLYYLAKMPWQERFNASLAEEMLRYVVAASGRSRKCLALDLDNTLWGGVVGEEGPARIKIGPGDPAGEAFMAFQYAVKALKQRGIVLSICSKNNKADAEEAFKIQAQMPLKENDFVSPRVNWDPKPDNLVSIADALNIGIDSLAFVDDNPAECSLVASALPQVKTLRLPPDPADYAHFIQRQIFFERLRVTDEDRQKGKQYREQARREELRENPGDLSTFLKALDTELFVRPAEEQDIPRIHQLVTKTNQFNVTTKRYTVGEIERFLKDDTYGLWLAMARDRYGDLGTIGLYLLSHQYQVLNIDSFVMSCRALGRGIETAFMNQLKLERLEQDGVEKIKACFIPTRKNAPASKFFETQGFEVVGLDEAGAKHYELPAKRMQPVPCPHVRVITRETAVSG
ncbi:MAG: HAD-IIIC family phosphatase [Gammaproteobacteria bacterium]